MSRQIITIDEDRAKCFEQAYTIRNNYVYVFIVNALTEENLDNFQYGQYDVSRFYTVVTNNPLYSLKAKTKRACISVKVDVENMNSLSNNINYEMVEVTENITFSEAEVIWYGKHVYSNIIQKCFEVANSLRKQRIGYDFKLYETTIENVIGELSIYVNYVLGHYLFTRINGDFQNLRSVKLYLSKKPNKDEINKLVTLFSELINSNESYISRQFKHDLHILCENGIICRSLLQEIENRDENNVELYSRSCSIVYRTIDSIISNYHLGQKRRALESLKTLCNDVNGELCPSISYFNKKLFSDIKISKPTGEYFKVNTDLTKDYWNQYINHNIYVQSLTQPINKLNEEIKFLYVSLIYYHLKYNELKTAYVGRIFNYFIENVLLKRINEITQNENERSVIIKEIDKDLKKNYKRDLNNELFNKQILFYGIIMESFKDDVSNDRIIQIRYPIRSFYNIPVNKSLNVTRLFSRWTPIDENYQGISFNIKLYLTNNNSNEGKNDGKEEIKMKIDSNNWKIKLKQKDLDRLIEASFISNSSINIDVLEHLRSRIKESIESSQEVEENIESKLSLNSIIELNVAINTELRVNNTQVLAVQYCVSKMKGLVTLDIETNKYNRRTESEIQDPDNNVHDNKKSNIQLIRFNSILNYCLEHNAHITQDFIWLVRKLKLLKKMDNKFETTLKRSRFIENFWFENKNIEERYDHICLRFLKQVEEYNSYVCVHHGVIENYAEVIIRQNKCSTHLLTVIVKLDEFDGIRLDEEVTDFETQEFEMEIYKCS